MEYNRRSLELPSNLYSWERPENQFAHTQVCRKAIAALVAEGLYPLDGRRVLDVGCGEGRWLLEFAQWGARAEDLYGIDLLEERIAEAKLKLPGSHLDWGEATCLPWPNQYFDLVTQFTVFTSILDFEVKRSIAAEMIRVTRPGGAILWYDFTFNNPKNKNVRGVGLDEMRRLFPGCRIVPHKITLAPPLARRLVPFSWTAALALENLRLFSTHCLALIQP